MNQVNKYPFTIFCILLFAFHIHAQNQISFEQYYLNQIFINPAYAGSQADFETDLFYHNQWTDMPGAPTSLGASVHAKLANEKIGLGIKLIQENIGAVSSQEIGLQYAYRIYTSSGVLAIGIEGNITNYQLAYSDLSAFQDGDQAFIQQPLNTNSPNAGAGIYFHSKHFYAGLSVPLLLEDSISGIHNKDISQANIYSAYRHYYLTSGAIIGDEKKFAVRPTILAKYAPDAAFQAEAALHFILKNSFLVGGSYRTNNNIAIMAEYIFESNKILKRNLFGLGYAYSFTLEPYQNLFGPTHEIYITYRFDKHTTDYSSPRFF